MEGNGKQNNMQKNVLQFSDMRMGSTPPANSFPRFRQSDCIWTTHIQIKSQMDAKQLIVNQFYCCKAQSGAVRGKLDAIEIKWAYDNNNDWGKFYWYWLPTNE